MTMVRETEWDIAADDGARIYGATNQGAVPSNKCIVITHGLTANLNAYQFKHFAMVVPPRGYDVIRFNLYDAQPGGRRLHECTLDIHSRDLNAVLSAKASGYDKVFVVGHSYGGPTVMNAQPKDALAVSLWDPSFDIPGTTMNNLPLTEFESGFYLDWRSRYVLGRAFVEEGRSHYGEEECLQLSETFGRPIQVIIAENGGRAHRQNSWHSRGHEANERLVIMGADHCFNTGDTADKLIDKTLVFFDRF